MDLSKTIGQKDADIITQVVDLFLHEGIAAIKLHLVCIFGKDITVDHFILMGQVIGLKGVTDNETPLYSNSNIYGKGHN